MDQLSAMRAFVRVVESGTFTHAADLLDMPKPTVTKLIQTLEARLRTKLLNRTTRRVSVTPDGAAYYERAIRILGDLDELDGSMLQSQAGLTGRLRVDVSSIVANLVILPALADFHDRHPGIRIDLGVSDRPADLVGENVDCVVRGGDILDQSLIARRIATIHSVACATPGYLQRHGTPNHPQDLERDHLAVGYFSARTGRQRALVFAREGETLEVKGRYTIAVNDASAYMLAGLGGHGIFHMPLFMAKPHLAAGELMPVLTDWSVPPLALHVVYPPNRHLSARLRAFVDWIAGLFADPRFALR